MPSIVSNIIIITESLFKIQNLKKIFNISLIIICILIDFRKQNNNNEALFSSLNNNNYYINNNYIIIYIIRFSPKDFK